MTYKNFYDLIGDATTVSARADFIAEYSTSAVFMPTDEAADLDAEKIAADLGNIWDLAHISVKDIRTAAGLTQVAFAVRFAIPRRTVENWEMRNTAPIYVRLLLADACGLIAVNRQ